MSWQLKVPTISSKYYTYLRFFFLVILIYFSGWGKTKGGGKSTNVLQQAMLPVVAHKTCRKKMKLSNTDVKVHKGSMLCAGGQGKGGCQVTNKMAI